MSLMISERTEALLTAEAKKQGLSVDALLEKIMSERSGDQAPPPASSAAERRRAAGRKSLAQLFGDSPFKGLDIDFEREPDYGRDVTL